MINTLIPIIILQLFICGWIGYAAIVIYRNNQNMSWLSSGRLSFLHCVFSPVAGLLAIYWISMLAIPFPQGKLPILAALFIFATWKNVGFLKKQQVTMASSAVLFVSLVSLLLLVFNCINKRLYYTFSVIFKKYGEVNAPKIHID